MSAHALRALMRSRSIRAADGCPNCGAPEHETRTTGAHHTCLGCGLVRGDVLREDPFGRGSSQSSVGAARAPDDPALARTQRRVEERLHQREHPVRRAAREALDAMGELDAAQRARLLEDAEEDLARLDADEGFRRPRSDRALAAALVVIARRRRGMPVEIEPVARAAAVPRKDVAAVVKRIQRTSDVRAPPTRDLAAGEGRWGMSFRTSQRADELVALALGDVVFGGRSQRVYVAACVVHALRCPRRDRRVADWESVAPDRRVLRSAGEHAHLRGRDLDDAERTIRDRVCPRCRARAA